MKTRVENISRNKDEPLFSTNLFLHKYFINEIAFSLSQMHNLTRQ